MNRDDPRGGMAHRATTRRRATHSGLHRRDVRRERRPGPPGPIVFLILVAAFFPASSALAAQGDLRASAASVERVLASGQLAPLVGQLSPGGVLLALRGQVYPGLRGEQALAALQEFFGDHESGRFSNGRIEASEGDVGRGFVEFGWATAARGTSESLRYRIYLGFVWMDRAWRIDEFRVLPAQHRARR